MYTVTVNLNIVAFTSDSYTVRGICLKKWKYVKIYPASGKVSILCLFFGNNFLNIYNE